MRTRLLSLCLALLLLLSGLCLPTVAESGTVEVYITLGDGLADEAASSSDPAAYLQTPGGGAAYASLTAELDAAEAQLRTLVPGIEIIGRNWYLSAGLAVRLPAAELTALGRFAAARDGAVGLAQIGYRAFPAETAAEAADTVSAEYAPALVGADALHAEGMRGACALVAVIDSGYDLAHPAFAAHEGVGIVLDRTRLVETFPLLNLSQSMPEQVSAEVLYISDKIPMAYDYADSDFVVTSAQSHGTHVASIIGGGSDAGGAVVGIAPDAQLMLLKTFSDKSTAAASEYAIYCAVEDALLLGADVINISLGSPPGFPYRTSSFSIDSFIVKARELGCAVVCAVGNEGRVGAGSYYDTTADIDLPLAANPDYGMTAEPASFPSATAVGAFMPDRIWAPSLSANGFAFSYDDSSEGQGFGEMDFIRCLNGQTLPLLTVPGLGAAADYAGLDATGKLVLVERGTITFTEKLQAAADAGAVGMICYDNVDGDLFSMAFDAMPIPAVFIRRTDGLRLAAMADADRRVTVSLAQASGSVPADAGQPAYYSSRGSGLMIRPEVVAPGTVFAAMPGGRYGSKSGSSMATPIVSGLLALAAAADRDSSSPAEQLNTRLADLITTAVPLFDDKGLPYSVRRQGGGSVDAAA
ncbi:MAG: S8 family serine peptidase, partial [Clostridia bacterium]|nr:S8 family serine peptidase [Clostridia bacterium]